MTSFGNKKALRFTITLGTGKFGSSDNNRIVLEGFRSMIDIDKAGGVQMSTLRARVYGVRQQDMNSITTLQWRPNTWVINTVEVVAIDGPTETLVFAGNIINAWADYQAMPDVFLMIQAQSAFFGALNPVPPKSFKGTVDAATIFTQIAADLGLAFENNGVNLQVTDAYLPNTALEQAKDLCAMVGCVMYIDDKTLAITPVSQPRAGQVPVISSQTGMVGYPTFDSIGINFKTLFNAGVTFGGLIQVDTDVQQAAGQWIVASVAHRLEAEKPDGAWFSTIRGITNGAAIVR